MVEDLHQRLAKVETIIEEHSKMLSKQQEKNEVQTELNILLKMQIEINKEQNKQMEKFSETLDKIDKNLTNLNNSQQQLGERVTEIEGVLSNQKIDVVDLIKSGLGYVVTAIGGIVLTYVYMKLRLK